MWAPTVPLPTTRIYTRGVEGGVDRDMAQGIGSGGDNETDYGGAQGPVSTSAATWTVLWHLESEDVVEGMGEGAGDDRTYERYSP